jgi:hypothetical protein
VNNKPACPQEALTHRKKKYIDFFTIFILIKKKTFKEPIYIGVEETSILLFFNKFDVIFFST